MESILNDEFLEGLTGAVASREAVEGERVERRTPQPTLIIGLGGTGAEVAGRLKQHLSSAYRDLNQHSDMLKFLVFDTIGLMRQQNQDIPKTFSEAEEEYINLAQDFNGYAYLQENYSRDKSLRDWWDNRYNVSPQYQEWGAKRVRQLGRLFLHHMHYQVESVIQQKVSETCTLFEDLVRDQNLADVGNNFRVYVVSSTCGGTGSGIFLDILYKVWVAVMSQGRIPEIRSFIFLPGIYEEEVRKKSLELVQAHRANAYAFLKEVDYFLSPGADLNKFILDAKTRDSSQRVLIPTGNLSKYVYLIDRQLGNLGNLDRPEDAYDLVSDAMYQMIVTPVGQEEEGVGLTNIDAVVEPAHQRQGKRTAYSSLGLSRILFPRNTIQSQLVYRFMRDMVYMDLTADAAWMDESVRKDERLQGLVAKLGTGNLEAIDDLSRPALDFLAQVPTAGELVKTPNQGRLDKLIKEKDLNDSRITEALFIIDRSWQRFERDTRNEATQAIVNLVNNCELGVVYSQKVMLAAKKQLRSLLRQIRAEKLEFKELRNRSNQRIRQLIDELTNVANRTVPVFRSGQTNKKTNLFAAALRETTEATLLERIAEKKEHLLETLVGQEQVVEQRLDDDEIVVDRKVQRSLFDHEMDKVNQVIDRLNNLADKAEERAGDRSLARADRGATITTQVFPADVLGMLDSAAFRTIYEDQIKPASMPGHVKTILSRLAETEELHGQGLYNLADKQQELAVKKVLIAFVSDHVRRLFRGLLNQTAQEAAIKVVGHARFSDQVVDNLFELSQPCWNYDKQKAHDPGATDLPRTYSLGYSDPDSLPMPGGQNKPGLVRTADNHQITLLQAQHGLPLFALRVIPTMRADYKHYMELAKSSGTQPLHINRRWGGDTDALQDIKTAVRLGQDDLCDFALGLFTDYMVYKQDPTILRLIHRRPIDKRRLRGYVHQADGGDYQTMTLVERDGAFVVEKIETISTSGRAEAAENFANFPESARAGARLMNELEQAKQYELITDLEEYIERMIVNEIQRQGDEEERQIMQQEYESLISYLDHLRDQRRRGLPLAA